MSDPPLFDPSTIASSAQAVILNHQNSQQQLPTSVAITMPTSVVGEGTTPVTTSSTTASTTPAVANPPRPQPTSVPTRNSKVKKTLKVIIIGDAGVGKTCLSFRFCNGRFPENTEATIGVDFRERTFEIDDELVRVQLWDTAGQERYRASMMAHYYRNVHAVVFVYDLTNRTSFDNLHNWVAEANKYADATTLASIPRIVIGNKCDVVSSIAVTTDEAQRFADAHDMPAFETSAKADSQADHVESILLTLVHKLREHKAMHVQSEAEREKGAIKVENANDNETDDGGLCGCL